MNMLVDARVPVIIGNGLSAAPGDALLIEGEDGLAGGSAACFLPLQGCAPGCACCPPRAPAGRALTGLLHDRARGKIAFFNRVVVVVSTEAGRAEIEAALDKDPVASACFKRAV